VRITAISCVNHRAIPDLQLPVSRHVVLVGPNDCGKTSLLRALDALLAGGTQQLYATFTGEVFRDSAQSLGLTVTFSDFSDDERAAFPDEIDVVPGEPGEPDAESMTVAVTATCDGDDIEIERHFVKPTGTRPVRRSHLGEIGWSFLPATRSPERELGVGRLSALRSLLSSIDLGDDETELVEMFASFNARLDGVDAVAGLRGQLASSLTELFPRTVDAQDLVVRVTSATEDDPTAHADVHLKGPDGPAKPLHRQSDGLRALTTIVVQRLAAPSPLLAVDEPEIHLHPRSQARVGSLLASQSGQCIVATHSTAVLTAFEPMDAVAMLPGRTRQLPRVASSDYRRFFAQWWTPEALEPLTARVCVLVEGPSDRILLRAVGQAVGADLDRAGCAVVVAHGAQTFKPLVRLFGAGGFDIPLAGVVDESEVPIVAGALGVESDIPSLREVGWETCVADLEDECVRRFGVERHFELITSSGIYDSVEILSRFDVGVPSEIPSADYTAWCRSRKIELALALAATMETSDAEQLAPLRDLATAIAGP
jgi:putative ATP-dependent endonuclease of the OLD family